MFISMAVFGLTTYAMLATYPTLLSTLVSLDSKVWGGTCSQEDKDLVWRGLPECQPRNTLVKIPLPKNPHILQVVPGQVEVARCAGTCHSEEGLYQRCVAIGVYNTSVKVLYEQMVAGAVQEVCDTVEVETHRSCRCGCEEVECSTKQEYDRRTCQCRCVDRGAMGQCLVQYNKMWDPDLCQCRCRPEEWKECSTGFNYDGVYSCQCLPQPVAASTPLIVTLGVLVVVLLGTSASFFIMFRKTKQRLFDLSKELQADRLFPVEYER